MAVVFTLLASSVVSCARYADGAIDPTGSTTAQLSDPALARTPPMGFNNWNAFGCDVSETLIKETADFFVATGLKDLGYTYVNIDDCWSLKERGEDGRLVPDPERFPSGIKGVADYVHDLGLKLGIYGDAGTKTCAGYPASLGNEELDAQTWAEWGVDYVKYDNCHNQSDGSLEDFVQRYTAMRDALAKTGRPIVYSICEWGQSKPWEWAQEVGHLWRTTGDIHDSWTSVRSIIEKNLPLAEYAGPGHWNDPDMLEIGNGGMTATEYRTHMSMWAMMSAPLIIGTDLRTIPEPYLAMLSNKEIIAIDQDPLGVQGAVVYDNEGLIVVDKPLATGERAIALYNSTDVQATISVPVSVTGLKPARAYRLHDVWTGQTMQAKDTISAGVSAHGTVVYVVKPATFSRWLPPLVSIGGKLDTVIVGLPEGATLTTTATNHGISSARHVEVMVEVPEGWNVMASGATREGKLATGDALATTWNVRAPEGTEKGRYPITVTTTYTWRAPFFWLGMGKKEVSVTTELTGVAVNAPTDGATHLSLLFPVRTHNGLGPVEIDQSNGGPAGGDGNLISVNGRIYTRGIGTQAASEIVYYLGGRCYSLTTDVGIDDSATEGASGAFAIYTDDVLAAKSGPMKLRDDAQTLTVDLSDATWLRLVTETDSTDAGVPTDWAKPQIVCGNSTDPTTVEVTLFSFETLEEIEPWTVANVDEPGSMAQSPIFHTEGEYGLEVVGPPDGNWFGQSLEEPLDLSAYSMLKFDLKTGEEGTITEVAFRIGEELNRCAGGLWTWTDTHSTKTITAEFSGIECSAGVEKDLTDIRAIWLFVKAATVHIDNVRVE
jgi:alpha-galactosidase